MSSIYIAYYRVDSMDCLPHVNSVVLFGASRRNQRETAFLKVL